MNNMTINNMNNNNFQMNNNNQMNQMNQINQINNMNQMNQMNNMDQMNQINNMNQMSQINNNFPMNAEKNYSFDEDSSYINSVLLSLANLECIHDWFNKINPNFFINNVHFSVTKEFYQILKGIYSGNQVEYSIFIFNFKNKFKSLKNKELDKDPYHFLFYFLDFLHTENNYPINPNFDKKQLDNLENMKNDSYMYNLFGSYFQQTLNSLVSQYFYNIEKSVLKCQRCCFRYYYHCRKIFTMNVDEFFNKRNLENPNKFGKLDLEECFDYYTRENNSNCGICHDNVLHSIQIVQSTKILIIFFKRQQHLYQGDINFKIKIDFLNKKYNLKACISLCNIPKYFTDVFINNICYRYMDDKIKVINIPEIYDYEPQLLIYELEDFKQYQINTNMNRANTVGNSGNMMFVNPFNYNINQMMLNNNFNNIVFTPAFQYQQMLIQKQQEMFNAFQLFTMAQSANNNNANNFNNNFNNNLNNNGNNNVNNNLNNNENNNLNNNNQNSNSPFLTLEFLVVPKDWDQSQEKINHKIKVQVTSEDNIEKAINNFYIKVQKKKEAIEEFKFNNNTLDVKSQQKLKDSGFKEGSKVLAIQSDNFENLNLIGQN